jgi:hypothetical protein
MVALLPRDAKRRLRAACRAGRAAADSRVTALAVPLAVKPTGLPAAVARMPQLRSLECCFAYTEGCAELAGALEAAPASLAAFKYEVFESASADGPRALADAIASRPGLTELDLQLRHAPAQWDAFVAAVGRLPRLRTLRLSAVLHRDADDPWRESAPALALSSTLQASAVRSLTPRSCSVQGSSTCRNRTQRRPTPFVLALLPLAPAEASSHDTGIASRLNPDTLLPSPRRVSPLTIPPPGCCRLSWTGAQPPCRR